MSYLSIIPLNKIPLNKPQVYTYTGDENLGNFIIGQVVEIPLGKGNSIGVINNIGLKKINKNIKLKSVKKIFLPYPLLTENQLRIAFWASNYYLNSLGVILKMIIPKIPKKFIPLKNLEKYQYKYNLKKFNDEVKPIIIQAGQQERIKYYSKIIRATIKKEKQILFLIPELAMMPQIKDILIEKFKNEKIIEISSELSYGKYFKNYLEIMSGKAKVIIGTRQSIFLPFYNLGLIILEDEHNLSYKQWDMNPRYNAKKIAIKLAKNFGSELIFGSNSPSIDTFHNYINKKFNIIKMTFNYDKPTVVDMRDEFKGGNFSILSNNLINKLETCLKYNKQAIIFVNRRASSLFIMCRDCGHVLKCPKCSSSLVEYANNKTTCLHCGYNEIKPLLCPKCYSVKIKSFGTGTEKVYIEIKKIFTNANISIIDQDNIKRKNDLYKIYQSFDTGKIDFLIGTQIVLSWNSFNLDTIGIINIDSMINFPDWQANEKSYNIINQIIGNFHDKNIIFQTYNPESELFNFDSKYDYKNFYDKEIKFRKSHEYPPFSNFIKLIYKHYNFNKAKLDSYNLANKIKGVKKIEKLYSITGPNEALVNKVRNKYIFNIILKFKEINRNTIYNELINIIPNDWTIDVDPENLL